MKFTCVCSKVLRIEGRPRTFKVPAHNQPHITRTWTQIDGEQAMIDYRRRCMLSGARVARP